MKETIVQFDGDRLLGIVTAPAEPAAGRPGVVILNSGVLHRVGAHRLSVKLARRLAGQGFFVLRFDLSGIGDSRPASDHLSFEERAVADVRCAMDALAGHAGVRSFVLVGLCSGADNSYATSLVDERVGGLVLLDPYAYRTPGFHLRRLLENGRSLDKWRGFLGRHARTGLQQARARLDALRGVASEAPPARGSGRNPPPREVFGASLRKLVDRGGQVLIVYTVSTKPEYNDPGQFDEAFGSLRLGSAVRCVYEPAVNHTFTALDAQDRLLALVASWAGERFAPEARR